MKVVVINRHFEVAENKVSATTANLTISEQGVDRVLVGEKLLGEGKKIPVAIIGKELYPFGEQGEKAVAFYTNEIHEAFIQNTTLYIQSVGLDRWVFTIRAGKVSRGLGAFPEEIETPETMGKDEPMTTDAAVFKYLEESYKYLRGTNAIPMGISEEGEQRDGTKANTPYHLWVETLVLGLEAEGKDTEQVIGHYLKYLGRGEDLSECYSQNIGVVQLAQAAVKYAEEAKPKGQGRLVEEDYILIAYYCAIPNTDKSLAVITSREVVQKELSEAYHKNIPTKVIAKHLYEVLTNQNDGTTVAKGSK